MHSPRGMSLAILSLVISDSLKICFNLSEVLIESRLYRVELIVLTLNHTQELLYIHSLVHLNIFHFFNLCCFLTEFGSQNTLNGWNGSSLSKIHWGILFTWFSKWSVAKAKRTFLIEIHYCVLPLELQKLSVLSPTLSHDSLQSD